VLNGYNRCRFILKVNWNLDFFMYGYNYLNLRTERFLNEN
jgi:hypothetical protein